ncbi:Hypothetical predicted protein [Scomber scombrus]|uniref:Uncharacterized protein n=1 Tax=Scomber scombrus TaxID=13677 RepID=A0AAV1PCL0_SCOSC
MSPEDHQSSNNRRRTARENLRGHSTNKSTRKRWLLGDKTEKRSSAFSLLRRRYEESSGRSSSDILAVSRGEDAALTIITHCAIKERLLVKTLFSVFNMYRHLQWCQTAAQRISTAWPDMSHIARLRITYNAIEKIFLGPTYIMQTINPHVV